jgi:DNA repair protein RecN (Recombination protein N)
MLTSLYISNYALISELEIDFGAGFSSITGETGAGKSIIMGALSLILGQRADTKAIKTDADKCIIEATFEISGYTKLAAFFAENDIDNSDSTCIIRRELTGAGKSRAFINDTPVSLIVLRDLTVQLIDIHSQHDNLLLANPTYQLDVVDTIAQNSEILKTYSVAFGQWQQLLADLRKLEQNAKHYSTELDYIQFQYNQLMEAHLLDNEQEELEKEQDTLAHAEEIKIELLSSQQLFEEEKAVLPVLKEIINSVSKIKKFVANGDGWMERLQSTYIELKDINSELSAFADRVENNPERLTFVENRLSELFTLQKKYKVNTVAELIDIRDEFELQLQKIESFDEDIQLLQVEIETAFTTVKELSEKLTASRQKVVNQIEQHMIGSLTELGMPNIQFKVQLSTTDVFTINGQNEVQFLFSANKNREVQPVQLIASGGEVSRLMLSIKALIANKSDLPTIIFDEIDTGVSGEIAHRMGEIMQDMGGSMQVITITHLPQIAAKSLAQYRVYKDDSGKQTQTFIEKLNTEQRINEIAQMLSGKNLSEISLLNAKELLDLNS